MLSLPTPDHKLLSRRLLIHAARKFGGLKKQPHSLQSLQATGETDCKRIYTRLNRVAAILAFGGRDLSGLRQESRLQKSIPGADQRDRGLWGRECIRAYAMYVRAEREFAPELACVPVDSFPNAQCDRTKEQSMLMGKGERGSGRKEGIPPFPAPPPPSPVRAFFC